MAENGKIRFPLSDNPSLYPPVGNYYVWLSNDGFFKKMDSDGNITNLSSQSITDMEDVVLTDLADGDLIAWDEDSQKWVNITPPTGDVNSVNGILPDAQGNVLLDPDDLDDSLTLHKFVSQDQIDDIAKIDTIEGLVDEIDMTKVLDENDFVVAQGLDKKLNIPAGTRLTFGEEQSKMVRIGQGAGESDVDDDSAISIGYSANGGTASKPNNISIGNQAGLNAGGTANVNLGVNSGSFTGGGFNVHLGNSAGQNRANPSNYNICLGENAGYYKQGSGNIYIGEDSGARSTTGTVENDYIRIGKQSSQGADDELIVGDMPNKKLTINGGMTLNDNLTMSSKQIKNLANPSDPQDAVTRKYFEDNQTGGAVDSVNGETGVVTLNTSEIPEPENPAQTDFVKYISQGMLDLISTNASGLEGVTTLAGQNQGRIADLEDDKIDKSEKGANDGVATLDGTGKIPSSQLPDIAGDVTSVNGKTGVVTLNTSDIPVPDNPESDASVNYISQDDLDLIDTNAGDITTIQTDLDDKIDEFTTGLDNNTNYVFQRNNFNGSYNDSWVEIADLLNTNAPVKTVHGRSGDVVSASGDYTSSQITETTDKQFISATKKALIDSNATNIQTNTNGIASANAAIGTLQATKLDDTDTGLVATDDYFLNRNYDSGTEIDSWVSRGEYLNANVDVGVTEIIAGNNITIEEGSDGSVAISASGGGGGGSSTFEDLTDTPNDYTSFAGFTPCVNTAENGLEYVLRKKVLTQDLDLTVDFDSNNPSDYPTVQEAFDYIAGFDPAAFRCRIFIKNISQCTNINNLALLVFGGTWAHVFIEFDNNTNQNNMKIPDSGVTRLPSNTQLMRFYNCITPTIGETAKNYSVDFNNKIYGIFYYENSRGTITGTGSLNMRILNGTEVGGGSDTNTQNAVVTASRGAIVAMNGTYIEYTGNTDPELTGTGQVNIGLRVTGAAIVSWFSGKSCGRRASIFLSSNAIASCSSMDFLLSENPNTNKPIVEIGSGSICSLGKYITEDPYKVKEQKPFLANSVPPNTPTLNGTVWENNSKFTNNINLKGTSTGVDVTAGSAKLYPKGGTASIQVSGLTWTSANPVELFQLSSIIPLEYLPDEETKFIVPQIPNGSVGIQIVCTVKTDGNLRFNFYSPFNSQPATGQNIIDDFTITWIYGSD